MGCSYSKSRKIKLNNSNFEGYFKVLPNELTTSEVDSCVKRLASKNITDVAENIENKIR